MTVSQKHTDADASKLSVLEYAGHRVLEITFHGKRCWILAHVEAALGYAPGSLKELVTQKWAAEFLYGKHIDSLEGVDLKNLRSLLSFDGNQELLSNKARRVLILYQEGYDLLWLKDEKTQQSRELRALLVDHIIPQLRETGTAALPTSRTGQDTGVHRIDPAWDREMTLREREITAKERELDRSEKILACRAIHWAMNDTDLAPVFSSEDRIAWKAKALEIATGNDTGVVAAIMPTSGTDERTMTTPRSMAHQLGFEGNTGDAFVGTIITDLGLKVHAPGEAEPYPTKAENSNRTVQCWRYGPERTRRILEEGRRRLASKKGRK